MSEKWNEIDPIFRERLSMKVAEAILAYMRGQGMKKGDRLPSERQLAGLLSAGRNTVREAIRLLREEGLLEVISGRGTFVLRNPPCDGRVMLRLMQINYRDLLEIKVWLEQLAIRRAALCAREQQLDELERRAQAMIKLWEEGIFSVEQDGKFHTQLLSCAGSSTLSQLVLSLIDELNQYSQFLNGCEAWLKTVPYHMDMARALKERKLSLALAAHEYIYHLDVEALENMNAYRMEEKK